jgi:hypothetical protein
LNINEYNNFILHYTIRGGWRWSQETTSQKIFVLIFLFLYIFSKNKIKNMLTLSLWKKIFFTPERKSKYNNENKKKGNEIND